MKLYARVLNIRKHKNVTFMDCYVNSNEMKQLMFENKDEIKVINNGDFISVDGEFRLNNRQIEVFKVNSLLSHSKSTEWTPIKGINNEQDDIKYSIFVNSRNGGNQINIFNYKADILESLRKKLNSDKFIDLSNMTNVVEVRKNGSNIVGPEITGRKFGKPKYLKITHENQLKQACAILLKSVYCIEKAFRDMGEDNGHTNELTIFELVSLTYKLNDMIDFVYKMDEIARVKFEENEKLKGNFISKLEVIDYDDCVKKGIEIKKIIKNIENVLILNFPILSPFVKTVDEKQKENRWYMKGKYIGHFYEDENDYEKIKQVEKIQNDETNKVFEYDNFDFFKWGVPGTYSFGLSIDRWLQLSLGEKNINTIANPLGLDYVKRRKR